jgi:hypothetical protein
MNMDEGRVTRFGLTRTVCCTASVGGYALVRLWLAVAGSPSIFPDSGDYARVAARSIFDPDFYAGVKPWGLPLLWKPMPGPAVVNEAQVAFTDVAPVIVAQTLVSVAAWLFLVWTVGSLFGSRLGRLGAAFAVLILSLSSGVTGWDSALLSESLSLSLLVVSVGCLILLARRPSRLALAGALLALLLWSFTRDTNSWYALFLVPPIALALALRGHRRVALVLAAGTLALVGLVQLSFAKGHRGDLPIQNAIVMQTMTHQGTYGYFASRGMPVKPEMVPLLAERPVYRNQHDPRLADFRRWFAREGRTSYILFLAARPDISIAEPLRHLGRLYAPTTSELDVYHSPDTRTLLPVWLDKAVYPRSGTLVGSLALLALLGAGALLLRRQLPATAVVPAAMLAATLPVGVIAWNADGVELDRHLAGGAALAHLAVLLLGCLVVDGLVAAVRREKSLAPRPQVFQAAVE